MNDITSANRNTYSFIYIVIPVVLFLFFASKLSPFLPEDTFISFRYAENLAQGHGLTFNAGEKPVEGYSNLLWVLACTLLYKAGLELSVWAVRLSLLFGAGCIILLWFIGRLKKTPLDHMALPLILFSCSGPFILYSLSGMEMSLFTFLLLMSIISAEFAHYNKTIGFVLLSLSCFSLALCRPEGVIVYPIIIICLIYSNKLGSRNLLSSFRKKLVITTLIFTVLIFIYFLLKIIYFKEFFPTPFISKGAGEFSLLRVWKTNIGKYFMPIGIDQAPYGYYYLSLWLLAGSSFLFSLNNKALRVLDMSSFAIATALILVYVNFIDWMPCMRYYSALIGVLFIPISTFTFLFPSKNTVSDLWKKNLHFYMISIAIIIVNLFFTTQSHTDGYLLEMRMKNCMIPLGKWLGQVAHAESRLAIADIGAIPYYSHLKTLDISPGSLIDLHIVKHGLSKNYFFQENPDIVIFMMKSGNEPLFVSQEHFDVFNDDRFSQTYKLVGISRIHSFDVKCYWVYFKKTIFISEEQLRAFPRGN